MGHPYRATQEWSRHLVATNWTTCDLAKPGIAQVQGYCLAGGTELASNLTESEAAARIAASRSTEFRLSEAATFLAETRDEERDEREWERVLKNAIAAGELRAEKKGRSHAIRYGDLVDWEGEEVPLGPEWGYEAFGRAEPARNSASLRRVRTVR